MGKFFKNVLLYMVVIGILTVFINTVYLYADNRKDDYRKYKEIAEGIEICNLGSSHGECSFNYENIGKEYKCFNFALSSQMLSYDFRILGEYKKYLSKGAYVFIPISYFSFIGIKEEEEDGFDAKNKRYYSILPAKSVKEYDAVQYIYNVLLPSVSARKDLLLAFTGRLRDAFDLAWSSNTADEIDVEEDAEKAYIRHVIKNKMDEKGVYIKNKEEIDAVYSMIRLCKEEGFVPILITTPYLEEYTDMVYSKSPDFIELFYSMIDEIKEDTGVLYYDYSRDKRFSKDYKLFLNADHLNKYGAGKFVDILCEEVLKLK